MEPTLIIFKEYDTLRTEIISRHNNLHQLIGFGAAFATVLLTWLGSKAIDQTFWLATLAVSLVLLFLWSQIHIDVAKAAARIRQIEEQINSIAGEELLRWETHWGRGRMWAVTEFIERKYPK